MENLETAFNGFTGTDRVKDEIKRIIEYNKIKGGAARAMCYRLQTLYLQGVVDGIKKTKEDYNVAS